LFQLGWSNFNDLVAYTTNGSGISTGLRSVESSDSPFMVTRAYVPALVLHGHSGLRSGLRPPLWENFPFPRAFGPWEDFYENSNMPLPVTVTNVECHYKVKVKSKQVCVLVLRSNLRVVDLDSLSKRIFLTKVTTSLVFAFGNIPKSLDHQCIKITFEYSTEGVNNFLIMLV